ATTALGRRCRAGPVRRPHARAHAVHAPDAVRRPRRARPDRAGTRTVRMIEEAGIARDGARWLRRAETDTLAAIEAVGEITGAELAKAVPRLRRQIPYGEGKTWAGKMGMTTRVLFLLACEQRVVRGRPQGAWTSTRYRWAPMRSWLPEGFAAWKPDEARAELARRWLAAFGPGTVADLRWWTGWPLA